MRNSIRKMPVRKEIMRMEETNDKNNIGNILAKQIAGRIENVELSLEEIKKSKDAAERMICYYRCALLETETKFRVLNEQFSLQHERNPINSIQTRIKSAESIIEKSIRKNLVLNVNSIEKNINDIAGIRVVCSFIDDVYFLADCLAKQDDIKIIEVKDYIKSPKANGYRSLHIIIEIPIFLQQEKRMMKVEVQLRTIAMEFWSSLEHKLRYKKDISPDIERKISEELFECAEISTSLDNRMQSVRNVIEEG